jgi:uncharacterized protein YjbI with pentapeptide repeats
MANRVHLATVRRGVSKWNAWRAEQPNVKPDLRGAELGRADFTGANLRSCDLSAANLSGADITTADLRIANLSGAYLNGAGLVGANLIGSCLRNAYLRQAHLCTAYLCGADLTGVDLREADLSNADLSGANLSDANLSGALCKDTQFSQAAFVRTNIERADLTGARIYGISAWDVQFRDAIQKDLMITPEGAVNNITVDDLEMAQFMYLLLNNRRIRSVIETITSKVVVILGRFSPERKTVLNAIREELRTRNYLPVVFDFEKPASRDLTESVSTLAHMARFVIADITDARSIPQELMAIAPNLPSVPVQPILLSSQREYGMFEHFRRYPWVLEPYLYDDQNALMAVLNQKVIAPAEARVKGSNGT